MAAPYGCCRRRALYTKLGVILEKAPFKVLMGRKNAKCLAMSGEIAIFAD